MSKPLRDRIVHERLPSGIDLVLLPTETPDVVTARIALGRGAFETYERSTVAILLSTMLPSGIPGKRRTAVREAFERMGASVGIAVDDAHLVASLTCRASVFHDAFSLLMRVLAHPSPEQSEFTEAVRRVSTFIEQQREDTELQALTALARAQYRNGHPHWSYATGELIRELPTVTRSEVLRFHTRICSSIGGVVVIAGDIQPGRAMPKLRTACSVVPHTVPRDTYALHPEYVTGATGDIIIPIADKMNIDTYLSIPLVLTRDHPDFEALGVATAILGGSSSGRLFNELRTRRSLTYGAYASLGGFDDGYPGYLRAHAIFPNDMFLTGRSALREVVERFIERGVTAQELVRRKEEIAGKFTVGLSTTRGIGGALFGTLLAGKSASYLDEYPDRIKALTRTQVNKAIFTHLDMNRAMTSAAGGVREDGSPIV